jgi:hypothetical protein
MKLIVLKLSDGNTIHVAPGPGFFVSSDPGGVYVSNGFTGWNVDMPVEDVLAQLEAPAQLPIWVEILASKLDSLRSALYARTG